MDLPSLLLLLVFATPAKQCFTFPVPVVTVVSGASRIIPSAPTGESHNLFRLNRGFGESVKSQYC